MQLHKSRNVFFLIPIKYSQSEKFFFSNFTAPVINKILNYEAHQFVLFHSRKKNPIGRLAFFSLSLSPSDY